MSTSPRRRQVRRTVEASSTVRESDGSAVPVEEGLLPNVDVLPKPDGFGTEASTSSTDFVLLDEYEVRAKHVARMGELALSIPSNAEAKVSVSGTTYGPFSGATDVSVPLEGAVLPPGYQVRVHHRSTDGNSQTTRATVVALEV